MKRVVKMTFEKETKGAVRYAEEEGKEQMLVTLYIRKTALASSIPKEIVVTIESKEE